MTVQKMFIFGAGYSGKATAQAKPDNAHVAGTTRSPEKFEALRQAGIKPFVFDGTLTDELAAELAETTHLLISIAPDEAGDPVLNAAREKVLHGMPKLQWIGYLSTVGVYGDHGGAWVDETGECRPVSRRSVMRLKAENEWLALGAESGLPVAVLRLSGIYGPGRNALVNLTNGTAKRLIKPDQVFNRIHGEDIAGAAWHLAQQNMGGVFNVTDDMPSPPQDVVTYAAGLMGATPPPEIPFETAQLSPMARSFYGENKRVSNAAIKATGFRFRYPDYQTGFDAMWETGNWNEGEPRSPMKRG
ncbi:SDR family oxidoreductase [Pseudaminobacter soli (ex Li et al. 2025)]|uniref:NAD(P)-dependent oxidoreductase n=1 Tax=Pseudaminobacter soli (ex Li et al. 2025) TaxID=1295366 RepID=A0A2P7S640_9HYPH|nr:SDR family oxidoreductase [Mesorhizobium soli]PSJ57949.1 NAD(P)-dependent oxidoreductase [Mesorhizobium soli]